MERTGSGRWGIFLSCATLVGDEPRVRGLRSRQSELERAGDGHSCSARAKLIRESSPRLADVLLARALGAVEHALALFDADDCLVASNDRFSNLLGLEDASSLVGRPYEQLLDAWLTDLAFGSDEARACFRTQRLRDRATPEVDFDVRTHSGRCLRVSDRHTPEGGIVTIIGDVTEDAHRLDEARTVRAAAELANAAKSELLCSMSHELRTQLNAMLGFAQLLERDKKQPLPERHRERVRHILRGGEHLVHIIDDLLNLSRIEAAHLAIVLEPVNVLEVLGQVRTTLSISAATADIYLEVAAPAGAALMILADRTHFAQILMNFGSNAIKYNRAGGRVVFTACGLGSECVRVSVSDTGFGIPPERQAKLFQPFQRAGQETGNIQGTGMGLSINKRLAERMQGDVGFRSVWQQGSEFWVDLPVHVATDAGQVASM